MTKFKKMMQVYMTALPQLVASPPKDGGRW